MEYWNKIKSGSKSAWGHVFNFFSETPDVIMRNGKSATESLSAGVSGAVTEAKSSMSDVASGVKNSLSGGKKRRHRKTKRLRGSHKHRTVKRL